MVSQNPKKMPFAANPLILLQFGHKSRFPVASTVYITRPEVSLRPILGQVDMLPLNRLGAPQFGLCKFFQLCCVLVYGCAETRSDERAGDDGTHGSNRSGTGR